MNIPLDFGAHAVRPILCVRNVPRSIEYYVNALGFALGWAWNNDEARFLEPGENAPAHFALVACNKVAQIMLCEQAQGQPGMWLHLDVDSAANLDRMHARWRESGAHIVEPPTVRPWGMYEMRIKDLDGHVFRVSSSPETSR